MNAPSQQYGVILVLLAALIWSTGGVISRFIELDDTWAVVMWRSFFATLALLCFLLWREGIKTSLQLFRSMGWAGIGVGLCFAVSTTSFVLAISYTSVANVLLIQAATPLIAALLAWLLFREKVALATWFAIVGAIIGVIIMVSDVQHNQISLLGNGLALLLAFSFASATVITRRYSEVRMIPAVAFGTVLAGIVAAVMMSSYINFPTVTNMVWLMAFGVFNLGLGLALFVSGARIIPAALAALLSTLEPVLGPVWVWIFHGEIPSYMTVLGSVIILFSLLFNIFFSFSFSKT